MSITKAQFKDAAELGVDALLFAIRVVTEGTEAIKAYVKEDRNIVIEYVRGDEKWTYIVEYTACGIEDNINVYCQDLDGKYEKAHLGYISSSLLHHHLLALICQ